MFLFLCFVGVLYFNNTLPKATTSEETSSTGPNGFFDEDGDGVATLEEVPAVEKNVYNEKLTPEDPNEESASEEESQLFELLDNLNLKVYPLFNLSTLFYKCIIISLALIKKGFFFNINKGKSWLLGFH